MKLFYTLIITLTLSACGDVYDKYDGLIVVDGEGKKYQLKHNAANTYFVYELHQNKNSNKSYVEEANSKLKGE